MTDPTLQIHDIIIIGAGPCGLAVAARLREHTPGSLFTDSEHQRFHFMKASSHSRRTSKPMRSSRRPNTAPDRLLSGPAVPKDKLDILVLDAHGDQWMSMWNRNFERLGITHLRSPMFFHPDPRDRDGLRAFAFLNGRMNELREIEGVVGKELSKHQRKAKLKSGKKSNQDTTYLDERSRDDYFRPSQPLFKSFCEDVARRYGISNVVEKSEVNSIAYDSSEEMFTLQTSTGRKRARIVVLAIGSGLEFTLPPDSPFITKGDKVTHIFGKTCDSHPDSASLPPRIFERKSSKLAIVGGGLTSAQAAKLAADEGLNEIHFIHRGNLKTKHFDLDLNWLAKFKNKSMSEFYYADSDEERWEIMKSARGGGSVNPEYKNIIDKLRKQGILNLRENTKIINAKWDEVRNLWRLDLEAQDGSIDQIQADQIIYATGSPISISSTPLTQLILEKYPIQTVGGMPCLTDELMWREDVPLFVTGKLAGLRLGPGATNLEGARVGAEYIASKIADLVLAWKDEGYETGSSDGKDVEVDMRRLGLGRVNQFEALGYEENSC